MFVSGVFGVIMLFIFAAIFMSVFRTAKNSSKNDTQPPAKPHNSRVSKDDVFDLGYSNVAPRNVATTKDKASGKSAKTAKPKQTKTAAPKTTVAGQSLTVLQPTISVKNKDYDKDMQERHKQDCNVKHDKIVVEVLDDAHRKSLARSIVIGEVLGQPVCKKRRK
ncbi:MAG: hypothetical protein ACI4MI_06110 [Christensenellales bacterium]